MTAIKNFRVDSFVSGLAIKAPVNVATTVPIALSAEQTVNGVALLVGMRCLVKDQVDPIENGIYNVETSAWQRAGDMDGNRDIVGGSVVPAYDTGLASFIYYIVGGNANVLEPGTDALNFTVYYDPSTSVEVDTLQSVTDRGDTTDVPITFNPPGPVTSMVTLNTGGLLEINNSLDTGGILIGHSATTALRLSAVGAVTGFQFSNFTSYIRFLGSGGDGPSLIIAERASADPSLSGLGQIWVNSNPNPNELMYTNEDGDDINLVTELWDNGTRQVLSNALGVAVRVALFIGDDDNGFGSGDGHLYIANSANATVDFANQGQFWVRDTLDGEPMFTDDQGVDTVLNATPPAAVAGCKAYGSVAHAVNTASVTSVILNAEAYDTDTIHDNAVNNTRLTVPTGWTRIRLTGYVKWEPNGSAMRQLAIRKNGAGGTIDDDMTGYEPNIYTSAAGASAEDVGINIDSGIIRAVATDYFELRVEQTSGLQLDLLAGDHWFQMDLIE